MMPNRFEFFAECRGLLENSESPLDSFVVFSVCSEEGGVFTEIERSETFCRSSDPHYCTSFEIDLAEYSIETSTIRLQFFRRLTETSERLNDHEIVGKSTVRIDNILAADGNHLATQISHPSEARKVGIVLINAEQVNVGNSEINTDIQFDVCAAVLRKRDWSKPLLGQRYELQRAHKHDDWDGHIVWLPIYRSDRISRQRDSMKIVEFSSANLKKRHVCNGDEERKMRLTIYASPVGVKKGGNEMNVGWVEFTLRDLCEMNPIEEVLQFEGEASDDTDLGTVSILRAEPTDYGSHFSLQINHQNTSRYTSALGAKEVRRKTRKLPKKLSLSLRDRSIGSRQAPLSSDMLFSPACTLFSNSFDED